jgi:hypothetical protein
MASETSVDSFVSARGDNSSYASAGGREADSSSYWDDVLRATDTSDGQ